MNKKRQVTGSFLVIILFLVLIWIIINAFGANHLTEEATEICNEKGLSYVYGSSEMRWVSIFKRELTSITCERKIPNPNLVVIDIEKERLKNIIRKDCFYDWQLSFECNQKNGTIIPVVKNNTAYWTCSKLNYEVKAC
ncbi:MAG: hypothetical protein AABY22_01425 [Nanoarchaeota archaeon]